MLWAVALVFTIKAEAAEPEDFQVIKKLIQEGAPETAESQAEIYLKAYPQGANRDQVACWLGEILAWKGEAKEAMALLGQPLAKVPERERGALNLAKARALLDLKRPADAMPLLKKPGALSKDEVVVLRRLSARAAFDMDQPAEAAQSLKMIPEKQREAGDLLFLAKCLALSGDDGAARSEYQAALASAANTIGGADRVGAMLALAGCDYRLGDYQAAISAAEPAVATASARDAMLIEAWALHGLGDDAKAYDMARKAVPLTGWEDAALLAPLREALLAEDYRKAGAAASAFLKARPDSPIAYEAHLGLALSLKERGDAVGALNELESALPSLPAGEPKYAAAMEAAGLAWNDLRDWDRAKRHLALAGEVAPSEAEKAATLLAFARYGWEHGASGDAISALAELVKGHPGTPSIPGAYLLLGSIRSAQGANEQGEQAYRVVLESFPDSPEFAQAAVGLAEAYFAAGMGDEASGALGLTQGMPLSGADSSTRSSLMARIMLDDGRPAAAMAALLQDWQSCEPAAGGDESRFLMGLAQIESGSLDDAAATLEQIVDINLARAGKFRLANAMMKAGKYDSAVALMEGLAEAGGESGRTALWALSSWQAEAGKSDDSSSTLQRLASSSPDDPLAVLAQRKIEVALLTSQGPAAALQAIPAFMAAEPKSPERSAGLLREARTRLAAGDTEGAATAYKEYLDRFPSGDAGPEASLGIAEAAAKRGDWNTAALVLKSAPQGSRRDMLLGEACFHMRDMACAQAAFESALGAKDLPALTQEQILDADYKAGVAAVIQGKQNDAVTHWTAYALGAPAVLSERDRLFDVALWLQKNGNLEPALAALGRLRDAFRDAAIGFQYGYTLELMGKSEEALAAYLKVAYASSNAQWALTARYRAAELMVSLGRKNDAIALYKELVERTQGTVQGDFAKKRLGQLMGGNGAGEPSMNDENQESPAASSASSEAPEEKAPQKATQPASVPKEKPRAKKGAKPKAVPVPSSNGKNE